MSVVLPSGTVNLQNSTCNAQRVSYTLCMAAIRTKTFDTCFPNVLSKELMLTAIKCPEMRGPE